jgi:hypothetical protein
VFRRQKGESVAKAETPPKADSLDEQISALLESIEVDGKQNHSPERPVQDEARARPRRSLRRRSNRSKSTPARPPARKKAKKAPARRKAAPVAKKAAPRRKPAPARRAVRTRPRAQAHAQAPARARRPARRQLFADPATRELAFFVIAGLMIGAFVGILFALAG